ncbi:DUF4245 domain-containing protein [Streptomyces sp. TRM66268-LWL]|uniref:DUF4245 domain-containing protein n=2 Tax=Streptomyces polyasparticus TaxID=2767826 RepID=A0ABR7SQ19_9ACTN|nr:DUF4245 domain-containing protein [Streptomyces polyasparticus]
MVLSMAVIGAVVAVIYVFIPHDESATPVKAVNSAELTAAVSSASRAASYPLLAPKGLDGKDWKTTSVRYRGADDEHWHLGLHGPDGKYVGVEQTSGKPGPFIADKSQDAKDTGRTERIGGKDWKRYEGDSYDALVLQEGGATTVVTGSGSFARLTEVAGALRPAPADKG